VRRVWRRRLPLGIGLVLLGLVVFGAFSVSEGRELLRLAEQARPAWLLGALVLQLLTYLAQGEIFALVARAGGQALPWRVLARTSLLKLFADQALPSAGIGGAIVVRRELERAGLARTTALAGIAVNIVS
jgi:Mg2+-importing ATPase